MNAILESDYKKLKGVTLNPENHTAPNAYEHCEQVKKRVVELARLNGCTGEEIKMLENLAMLHDIGKIERTASPSKSVELLHKYGSFDKGFTDFIKYHDINLPWFQSMKKGEVPGNKAWRRLAGKVNIRLLCLFMVADRVDCPGGWKSNEPLIWFIEECKRRKLLNQQLLTNRD